MVTVEDPVVTLVCCNNIVFAALLHLTGIRLGTQDRISIPESHLHEPNVRLRGRIMILTPRDLSHQPDGPDWEWDGTFSSTSDLADLDSTMVDLFRVGRYRQFPKRNVENDTRSGINQKVIKQVQLQQISSMTKTLQIGPV